MAGRSNKTAHFRVSTISTIKGLILFAYIPFMRDRSVHKLPGMSFLPFFYSHFSCFLHVSRNRSEGSGAAAG